jgi:hypothetical protein
VEQLLEHCFSGFAKSQCDPAMFGVDEKWLITDQDAVPKPDGLTSSQRSRSPGPHPDVAEQCRAADAGAGLDPGTEEVIGQGIPHYAD